MAAGEDSEVFQHFSGFPEGETVIPECEVVYEGDLDVESAYKNCTKNQGHKNFIPVKDFTLENLPEDLRTTSIKRSIALRCDLTVRISVTYTSEERPDTYVDSNKPYPYSHIKGSNREKRYGTGLIQMESTKEPVYIHCPCKICRQSEDSPGKKKAWVLSVITSTHVIYDSLEALHSEFDCFYDSEDKLGVKTFHGGAFLKPETSPDFHYKSDLCKVACVTHDEELVKRLWSVIGRSFDVFIDSQITPPPEEVIVSHPHGGSKVITVGQILYLTVPVKPNYDTCVPIPFKGIITCRFPSNFLPDTITTGSDNNIIDWESTRELFRKLSSNEIFFPFDFSEFRTLSTATEVNTEFVFNTVYGYVQTSIAFLGNLFGTVVESCRRAYRIIVFLISERLRSMKMSNIRHPELIDIGFLLWRCYLSILVELFKHFDISNDNDNMAQNIEFFFRQITGMLLYRTLYERPHLRDLFDINGHLIENSIEDVFMSCNHSSTKDMLETVVMVLTGNATVSFSDEMRKMIQFFLHSVHTGIKAFKNDNNYEREKSILNPRDDHYLQPGRESVLPSCMTFTLPPRARYAYRYYKGNPSYLKFPGGTKLHLSVEGKTMQLPIPDGTEFTTDHVEPDFVYYVNYSTRTCPGSSGASVLFKDSSPHISQRHVHSCQYKNRNRSGLSFNHGGYQSVQDFTKVFDENVSNPKYLGTARGAFTFDEGLA